MSWKRSGPPSTTVPFRTYETKMSAAPLAIDCESLERDGSTENTRLNDGGGNAGS